MTVARPTWRSRARHVVTVLTALAVATSVAAVPAAAERDRTVYSVPYGPELYVNLTLSDGRQLTSQLTYEGWVLGTWYSRTPVPIPTDLVRYAWSPTLYAVSHFPRPLWHRLTPAEWQRMGHPSPRVTESLIPGTQYVAFPWGPEIYALLDGYGHELTYGEWAAAGHPSPAVIEIWSAPVLLKLGWAPGIAGFHGDQADLLTLEDWVAQGQPQPSTMPMLPGDGVCFVDGGPSIYYDGATFSDVLTPAQWQAAGSPLPEHDC